MPIGIMITFGQSSLQWDRDEGGIMPKSMLFDPAQGLGAQRFLRCAGTLQKYSSTLYLHFHPETALTAVQHKQIALDAHALDGITRASLDTKPGDEYVLVVETASGLTAEQVDIIEQELLDRCDFRYTASATAKVVRNSYGHHVGTVVRLEFAGGLPKNLSTAEVIKRSSVCHAELDGVALMASMRLPTRDHARIQAFAQGVAVDGGAYLTGLHEVTDDPDFAMLPELDWRPRDQRDPDEEIEEPEEK